MAFNGQFLVQLDDLKNPPKGINVVALPFRRCPDGMLVQGTVVYYGFKNKSLEELEGLELTVQEPPIYCDGWEFIISLNNTDTLQAVCDYLMIEGNGKVDGRRLIALESFEFV